MQGGTYNMFAKFVKDNNGENYSFDGYTVTKDFLWSFIQKMETYNRRVKGEFKKYNGATYSAYGCDDPKNLVVGQIYKKVFTVFHLYGGADYLLKGVGGTFDSTWFDDVPIYNAFVTAKPIVGYPMDCIKVVQNGKRIECNHWQTTTKVERVEDIEPGIFMVVTHNSIYNVMMLENK